MRDKSLHGYLINVVLHKKFGHSFSSSTLYPLLGLLEEEGYVEGVWETKARRKRKIYRITQKGEELLGSSILILDRICRELAVSSAGSKVSQV